MSLNTGFQLLLRLPFVAIMIKGKAAILTPDIVNCHIIMLVHRGLGLVLKQTNIIKMKQDTKNKQINKEKRGLKQQKK